MNFSKFQILAVLTLVPFLQNCTKPDLSRSELGMSKASRGAFTTVVNALTDGGLTQLPVYSATGPVLPGAGPTGLLQKPCASRMGLPHPDQGSGICSGNNYFEIALPTTGLSLSYNSQAKGLNFGFGMRTSLSVDSRIYMVSSSQVIYMAGDGSTSLFHSFASGQYTSGDLIYRSDDLRVMNATITLSGKVFTVSYPNGTTETFQQVASDTSQYAVTKIQDRNGNKMALSRDGNGFLQGIVDGFNNAISIYYGFNTALGVPQATQITDPAGRDYNLTYDSSGRLLTVSQPDGRATVLGYAANDASAQLASTTSVDGEALQYSYYLGGDLESITNQLGYVTLLSYSSSSVTVQTSFDTDVETFDSQGRLLTAAHNGITTKTLTRDTLGRVVSAADGLGNVTTYAYDSYDALTANFQAPNNVLGYFVRDANRQLTQTILAKGNVKTVTNYDPKQFGQVTQIAKGPGTGLDISSYNYDSNGNLWYVIHNGRTVAGYAYTPSGLLSAYSDSLGLTTYYAYNTNGFLISKVDPLGRVTSYTPDKLGNVLQTTTPTLSYSQQYDKVGNPYGTSVLTGATGGGNITTWTGMSYFSNGAPQNYASAVNAGGLHSTYSVTYQSPSFPGNITSKLLTDSRGVTYDFAK